MRIRTPLLLTAGFSVVIGTLAAACSDRRGHAPADTRPPVPVTSVTVAVTDLAETFETGGIVQARTTATITSRVPAPVLAVRVAPGDSVRSGQVLVVLDGRDLAARARSAQAAAAGAEQRAAAAVAESRAAEASLTLARATHDRIATLHAKRSATTQELDEATASLRAAEARAAATAARLQESTSGVTSAQADSEAAGTTESFSRITAPFDGVVTEKMVEPGNMATPGTPLVRVEDVRSFRLDVHVDESRAGQLTVGTTVSVVVEIAGERGEQALQGKISEIARAVNNDARASIVKIELPTVSGLRSGMFGRAHFTGGTRRGLTVPPAAVVRRGQVTAVFVITDSVARLRLIDLAGREVLAGLVNGDRVIVNPSSEIVDGRGVTEGGAQ